MSINMDHTGPSQTLGTDATGITVNGTPVASFRNIAVQGQQSVVADTTSDTLTLVAGTNISITTDPSTDSVTINSGGFDTAFLLMGA